MCWDVFFGAFVTVDSGKRLAYSPASAALKQTDTPKQKGAAILDFPRQARLLNKVDYDLVIRQADQRLRIGALQAIAKHNDLDHPRIGLIIAKRHLRLAVQRNRVKRLLRETFRQSGPDLPNVDLVVRLLAKPDMTLIAGDISRMFGKMASNDFSVTSKTAS